MCFRPCPALGLRPEAGTLQRVVHRRHDTHYQSAMDIATLASEKSENPLMKKLAQNIVSAQKREIEQMRR